MQPLQDTTGPAPVFYKNVKAEPCAKCRKDILPGALLQPRDGGILCLACAGLGGLVFLPSGDVALTRRAQKHAKQWAPVLHWSRARKRYERQGILVESAALKRAETECAADAAEREAKRVVESGRRERQDQAYRAEFAAAIRQLFPGCPGGVTEQIAEHACQKHSGRVGRCAAAKEFSEKAITLAVVAHVRHQETGYDKLLAYGVQRRRARERIRDHLQETLDAWRRPGAATPPSRGSAPATPAGAEPAPPRSALSSPGSAGSLGDSLGVPGTAFCDTGRGAGRCRTGVGGSPRTPARLQGHDASSRQPMAASMRREHGRVVHRQSQPAAPSKPLGNTPFFLEDD